MISLPGLTLATGREEWGRDILLTFARFVDRGMLPNVFPGAGDKPEYNTVDASLWFFEAWRAYLEASGDRESLAQVFLTLAGIVDSHLQGTRYGIHVDPKDALVVALVGRRLLTSYGLRSLSADPPDYKPHYTGDPWHRDGAYHQGTVWAWLLGHYALAEYRVHGDADSALERIAAMRDHLFDAGLGTISGIFEGESPHCPSGRPSQAWSVACVLQAWWRIKRT